MPQAPQSIVPVEIVPAAIAEKLGELHGGFILQGMSYLGIAFSLEQAARAFCSMPPHVMPAVLCVDLPRAALLCSVRDAKEFFESAGITNGGCRDG